MKTLKLKICGMKDNTIEVAKLQPDYLGFIFFDGSKRNFQHEEIPPLPIGIKKVGVFVNASINEIISTFEKYKLDVIQLHGDETKEFLLTLNMTLRLKFWDGYEVWKVFKVDDTFDFSETYPFVKKVDKFLFDTKGKNHGGNGETFNWEILKNYKYETPFFLSGGIGMDEVENIKELLKWNLPIYGIDINSKFETAPGFKNIDKIKKFKNEL